MNESKKNRGRGSLRSVADLLCDLGKLTSLVPHFCDPMVNRVQQLKTRLQWGNNSCCGDSPCPCTLGPARVPTKQAAAPPSWSTLTGVELPQANKVLHLGMQGHFSRVQLFAVLWTVACQASLSGGSPGKNTGAYWPILVPILFQSTVFPADLAANSPEYLVLPEPLKPKQPYHLHTWPSQTQVLQGSLRSKPQWMIHMQRWK